MTPEDYEKEWIRRLAGPAKKTEAPSQPDPAAEKATESGPEPRKTARGFSAIAGMDELKSLVTEGFINVLKHKSCAEAYDIRPPSMLFYGPAGCGKTFFAERMAEEVGLPLIKVVPDDLACTWIHGTQQKIGELFRNAEKKAPVLMFLDEFDAMVPRRSASESSQHLNGEVNEFLCMLNNAADRGIYVLAATNHPEAIDRAVLRTGRIDELIYIDMPDAEARKGLFRLSLAKLPVEPAIDLDRLAEKTAGYNCSDICYIVKTAARRMFNASIRQPETSYRPITQALLESVIDVRRPSVSTKDLREFERMRNEFSPKDEGRTRVTIGFQ